MTKFLSNKILKTLSVYLLILASFLTATFTTFPASASADNSFDNTDVLEDLRSSEGFNILLYPFTETKDMQIINFVEYCYSYRANMLGNYGLYVYVYNPKGIGINTGNANFIQMAVEYDEFGNPCAYEKFGLKFLSRSEESNYKNLFYKFKVVDRTINGTTFLNRVNSNERRYDVSGVEILSVGSNLATEYATARTYRFTGYAKGYGPDPDAESTLECDVKELETITLQTHSTYYRTGEYATNHRHDLTSVYFSVPNRFFDTYGALQKIKAEWYEYQTAPIVITSSTDVYDLLNPYIGVDVNNAEIALQIYTGYQDMVGPSGHYDKYDWAYNCNYTDAVNRRCNQLNYLFSTNGSSISNYTLSSERLKSYIETYNKTFTNGKIAVPGKNISADLFESGLSSERSSVPYQDNDVHHKLVNFDAGDVFDMLNYQDTNSGWKRFFAGLFGLYPREVDVSYMGISPIHIVTDDEMAQSDVGRLLLINDKGDDFEDFKSFYNTAKNNNEKVVLFRFAQTDYECLPVMCYNSFAGRNLSNRYGADTYVVSESLFLNFDIIELTFNKDGVYTVIPVVNSPIDIYNDITLPANATPWWEILLFYLLLVLLVIILAATGILPFLLKGIVYVAVLPFKGFAATVKAIHKHRKRKRNGD